MMNCPRCNSRVNDGDLFCAHCGTALGANSFVSQPLIGATTGPQTVTTGQIPSPAPMATQFQGQHSFDPEYHEYKTPGRVAKVVIATAFILSGIAAIAVFKLSASAAKHIQAPMVAMHSQQTPVNSTAVAVSTAPPALTDTATAPTPNYGVEDEVPSPNLGVQATQEPANLQATASASPVSFSATAQQSPSSVALPQIDLDWLKHLQRVESAKQALTVRTNAVLQSMLSEFQSQQNALSGDDADTSSSVKVGQVRDLVAEATKIASDWRALKVRFEGWKVPAECQSIASNYDGALGSLADLSNKVATIVKAVGPNAPRDGSAVQNALSSLTSISSLDPHAIDDKLKATDQGVQAICSQYGVTKWFSIDATGGSMPSLGMGI